MPVALDQVQLELSAAERASLRRILSAGYEAEVQQSRLRAFLGRYVHCENSRINWVALAEAVLRSNQGEAVVVGLAGQP
ncbi:hypothetical protein [Pseudaestuariivita sp.]|uniref:hypothetical protein n=1 Tax=Pseudaestuariivita sp. TaxID=2211669 RepID=UPI004058F1FB